MRKFFNLVLKVFCFLGLLLCLFGTIYYGVSHQFSNAFACSLAVFLYSFGLMCVNEISHE